MLSEMLIDKVGTEWVYQKFNLEDDALLTEFEFEEVLKFFELSKKHGTYTVDIVQDVDGNNTKKSGR